MNAGRPRGSRSSRAEVRRAERLDVSPEARQTFDRHDILGFWQATMPRPEQKPKKLFVDDEVLCTLFERLADTSEQAKLNFRFVLGLILMRKRIVIYETTRQRWPGSGAHFQLLSRAGIKRPDFLFRLPAYLREYG